MIWDRRLRNREDSWLRDATKRQADARERAGMLVRVLERHFDARIKDAEHLEALLKQSGLGPGLIHRINNLLTELTDHGETT